MKSIRMRTTAAGAQGAYQAGQTYQVGDEVADGFVAAGAATIVDDAAPLEQRGEEGEERQAEADALADAARAAADAAERVAQERIAKAEAEATEVEAASAERVTSANAAAEIAEREAQERIAKAEATPTNAPETATKPAGENATTSQKDAKQTKGGAAKE